MGNSGSHQRHRSNHSQSPRPHPQPPPHELSGNQNVFAAATPYLVHYSNTDPNSQFYPGYCPVLQVPFPYGHHHHHRGSPFPGRGGSNSPPAVPYVEHQKAVTIRSDVNLKKESLRVEPDEENPGQFLLALTFDATAPGSITIFFFAKEGMDCNFIPMKGSLLQPVTASFQQGLGQKFRQPSGTGIALSMFHDRELTKEGDIEVYPLVVRAKTCPLEDVGSQGSAAGNSQITLAVFEKKENGEYQVQVKNQMLWVNGMRYELLEIYGIRNSVDGDFDRNEPGKECVICLSEPQDTAVLPCRHMCMCSGCASVLRFQTTRCPICRQPVERLLEIKVSNKPKVKRAAVPGEQESKI